MEWFSGLSERQAEEVRRLVDAASAQDGTSAFGGHVLDRLPAGEFALHHDADGTLVGALAIGDGPDDPAEIVVAPQARGRGLGGMLLTAALDQSGAVWAHGDLPAAQRLAADRGLVASRSLLQFGRPLAGMDTEDLDLPDGARLRTFRPGHDEDAFLGVNARAFAWHPEQGRLDRAGLAEQQRQDWFDPDGFFLAVDRADTVLGFHWTKIHGGGVGEVYVIAVDPLSPIRRLGRPLLTAGLRYLVAQGMTHVILYVEADNEPALRLYEDAGFVVERVDRVYRR